MPSLPESSAYACPGDSSSKKYGIAECLPRPFILSTLILASFLSGKAFAGSAEVQQTYSNAFGAFLQGRMEDAASAYRYLTALGVEDVPATVNQAILARDLNKPEDALPLWIKASLLAPNDAFIWNQRGWCYLSMQRYSEARESFQKAISVSSITVWATEAQFGTALTEEMDGSPKGAIESLRRAFAGSPYLFPAVAAELARLSLKKGPLTNAELYFKQSLIQDPMQPDVIDALGHVYDELSIPKNAWLTYKTALDIDPTDGVAQKGMERAAKYMLERPERILPVRRLAGPLVQKPFAIPPSAPLRVGIFANPSGELAYVRRMYILSAADFRIIDLQLGEVAKGRGDEQWEIVMPPEGRVIEIRDVHHQLQYTTKQAFRIEPVEKGATVLIKSAELTEIKGVDIGDRELRGRVEVFPTPFGFQIVNELGIEEYLFSIVSAAMPRGSPDDALMAQAILSRTRIEMAKPHSAGNDASKEYNLSRGTDRISPVGDALKIHFCDSRHCQLYGGLTEERDDSTQAVLATFGGKLYRAGQLYPVFQHISCGWSTEDGVIDRPDSAPNVRSVADLERLTHGYPDSQQYCELSPVPAPTWSRWVRVFDGDMLRAHAEKKQYIGKLSGLMVLGRTKTGRVESMEVAGTRGKFDVDGQSAVADFFSPGGVRSTLFTLQPIYRGKSLDRVIVWGAGTGDGRGLCTAGALGMAHSGKEFKDILAHYFPGSEIRGMEPKITLPAKKPYAEPKQTTEDLLKRGFVTKTEAVRIRRAGKLRARNRRRAQQAREQTTQEAAVSSATVPVKIQKPKRVKPAEQIPPSSAPIPATNGAEQQGGGDAQNSSEKAE